MGLTQMLLLELLLLLLLLLYVFYHVFIGGARSAPPYSYVINTYSRSSSRSSSTSSSICVNPILIYFLSKYSSY